MASKATPIPAFGFSRISIPHGAALAPAGGVPVDLRRVSSRDEVERLCQRARFLPQGERVLVEAFFRDGRTVRQLAHLEASAHPGAGLRATATRISRRLRRAVRRMQSPIFAFVAARLERARAVHDSRTWPPERRRVAQALFLHGTGVRGAARALALSPYEVREHRRAVEAMFAEATS